ncbi:hypothetical protein OG413_38570 [Streptomyces sp. NBC_01433]|uniref:hypothetical protein n=1 Tax=Streptomyces sp. NBC_01433 TaxID=2903864 RepID=UPI00225853FB|nr:hypothetical protein [Streptomyces sp. NBC_01433]MCX4681112.1 hypothetical protein [Streptomyces sp. NBC_01433]
MPRTVPRLLVLITVLAGLLHVLGCAHGPQAAGMPRTDTVAAVAATTSPNAHPAGASVVAAPALCGHGAAAECTGVDEPAEAGPRADLPAPPAADDGLLPREGARWQGAKGRARCRAGGAHPAEHSRARAELGVWRT